MSIDEGTTTKDFSSFSEDKILESWIGQQIIGTLETGSKFFGKLVAFDDRQLLLIGNHGQHILIKRRKVARVEAA
jgi:small nuclear ribonucleoprotein (snRNP)-like protein